MILKNGTKYLNELKDHFLRLEEIFRCEVRVNITTHLHKSDLINSYFVRVYYPTKITTQENIEIIKEIESVKYRIESMYEIKAKCKLSRKLDGRRFAYFEFQSIKDRNL
jgi:hypothetical protein